MMQELVLKLSQKTGLSTEEAQQAVNVVVNHLKERLPVPLAGAIDNILADSSGQGDGMLDKAKAIALGVESMFGKKAE